MELWTQKLRDLVTGQPDKRRSGESAASLAVDVGASAGGLTAGSGGGALRQNSQRQAQGAMGGGEVERAEPTRIDRVNAFVQAQREKWQARLEAFG